MTVYAMHTNVAVKIRELELAIQEAHTHAHIISRIIVQIVRQLDRVWRESFG